MRTAYHTEAHEQSLQGKSLLVVNLTPDYSGEERNGVKKAIEQRLYVVFCKYVSTKA